MGCMFVTLRALDKMKIKPDQARVVIQGFGNVGSISAQMLDGKGCKIIAISDVTGGYYNKKGINIPQALEHLTRVKSLQEFKGGDPISNENLLELDCDVLIPAAKEEQITSSNAGRIKARIITEGANGPTTSKADPILDEKGILVIPDILANAGGVTVSYFEWVQNRMGYYWSLEDVTTRLERVMNESFDVVFDLAQDYKVSLRIGSYILAVKRVSEALKIRGIYG